VRLSEIEEAVEMLPPAKRRALLAALTRRYGKPKPKFKKWSIVGRKMTPEQWAKWSDKCIKDMRGPVVDATPVAELISQMRR
jgi:hypothetical protein